VRRKGGAEEEYKNIGDRRSKKALGNPKERGTKERRGGRKRALKRGIPVPKEGPGP